MITKYELTVKYISSLKAEIYAKNVKIQLCKAKIEYIDTHPEEFYTGHAMIRGLIFNINSLQFNITELQSELFSAQKKLDELLSQRGDVINELEDHKTVSEE